MKLEEKVKGNYLSLKTLDEWMKYPESVRKRWGEGQEGVPSNNGFYKWERIEQLLIVLGGINNTGHFSVYNPDKNRIDLCNYICINPKKLTRFQIESLTSDCGYADVECDNWCTQCPRAFVVPTILFKNIE